MRRKPLLGKYRTLASWDDDSCALAQVRAGTGSALFLGTLPRYSWSNLADGHLLLPLLQRMADRGAERFSTSISLRVNDASLPQSATDTPVRLDNAQGSHPSGSPADTAGRAKNRKSFHASCTREGASSALCMELMEASGRRRCSFSSVIWSGMSSGR